MNEFIQAGPVQYAAFKQVLRTQIWQGMMQGKISDWMQFFRMIEDGESHLLLREHVKYG